MYVAEITSGRATSIAEQISASIKGFESDLLIERTASKKKKSTRPVNMRAPIMLKPR